jgi:hypothetical protein
MDVNDRRSQLKLGYGQLEHAELYVVAARELVGADTEAGRAIEQLRQQLLAVADGLRQERREELAQPRRLRAMGD